MANVVISPTFKCYKIDDLSVMGFGYRIFGKFNKHVMHTAVMHKCSRGVCRKINADSTPWNVFFYFINSNVPVWLERPSYITSLRISLQVCLRYAVQWRTQEFCSGAGGGSTNSVEDRGQRERGSGGGKPPVRGSGGSCNLVQEISFHIVKTS